MNKKIRVGIIGGAGYAGGELVRLLVNHSLAELIFVHSKSNAGKPLHHVHQDMTGITDLKFSNTHDGEVDVLFLCTGHGESKKILEENDISKKIKVISLSQDFRVHSESAFNNRKFIYGLPELNRDAIKTAESIANPGCFATAIQLGLLPLAKNELLSDVYTTGITGSTGAGQTLSSTVHFSWRQNNIQAYKSLTHQHLAEINETLNQLQHNFSSSSSEVGGVHFVPWRGDFTRGIFVTSQLKCKEPLEDIYTMFNEFYKTHPFVKVSNEPIFLKQVVNTNNCFIHIEKEKDNLVIHSIIDNLLKGASGQALQNMNLIFGLDETMGLRLKGSYF